MKTPPRLLVVGDSPTVNTGFANVTRNICKRFLPYFPGGISIWGINYYGYPHDLPYTIYPAGFQEWNGSAKLSELLNLLNSETLQFTHVWFLQDCHQLAKPEFVKYLKQICDARGIHSTFYYPVDASMEKEWLECVAACDVAVTYTEYGRKETNRVRPGLNPVVLPHGVECDVYFPREDRMSVRERMVGKWVQEDDFLILNVNRNERRKAPQHSLALLRRLLQMGVKAKLIMHMPRISHMEYTDLELVGAQLGIPHGKHWQHNDEYFMKGNPMLTEEQMNAMYNAADLVLSTSLGEGFGLSLSEGAAAGCRVAAPNHTSCKEIIEGMQARGQDGQFIALPLSDIPIVNPLDWSRVRYPIDIQKSAEVIAQAAKEKSPSRYILSDEARAWLNWDRVAWEFTQLMGVS
jgi:D-inositol-3-phosphate glycosyltransferase